MHIPLRASPRCSRSRGCASTSRSAQESSHARLGQVHAVDGVSFSIASGETLGLVGESGCGKSTAGKAVLKLTEPSAGTIRLRGRDITRLNKAEMRPLRREMQLIFQDPFSSLNPRMTAGGHRARAVVDSRYRHHVGSATSGCRRRSAVSDCALNRRATSPTSSRADNASASESRVRWCSDRASFVCDECVSALDVSIQAQVINLLMDLQEEYHLAFLFIAHDLAVVEHISHRVAVMYLGRIVELTDRRRLFTSPLHPYTEALLSAVPVPDPGVARRKRLILEGDVPSPISPPSGCHFHPRCPRAMERCRVEAPELHEDRPGHFVSCHLHTGSVPAGS